MMIARNRNVGAPLMTNANKPLPAFPPLAAPRSLTHQLVAQLTAEITSGRLNPGARLPTEQEMIAAAGVSRTVVREAVAALRAEGLVVTRQGVGAFVADTARRPFRIEVSDPGTLREVLEIMELRTGIEIEAAGLAAERASAADRQRMAQAFEAIEDAIERGESGVEQDFAFHRAIAQATGNPKFLQFLNYLGHFIIPRQTVSLTPDAGRRRAYLRTFQKEHGVILSAIGNAQAAQARAAMRRHLSNSRRRYSQLAARLEEAEEGA
jgi:GntR family transcriptional regulator, transcriptional repressor for pyruvate dehydrogenase complex